MAAARAAAARFAAGVTQAAAANAAKKGRGIGGVAAENREIRCRTVGNAARLGSMRVARSRKVGGNSLAKLRLCANQRHGPGFEQGVRAKAAGQAGSYGG